MQLQPSSPREPYLLTTVAPYDGFAEFFDDDDDDDSNGQGGSGNAGGGNGSGSGNAGSGKSNRPNPFQSSQHPLSFLNSQMDTFKESFDITEFVIDYNAKFASAAPAMFREGVVLQMMATLIGKTKPNPLLVGPAGCGKTRIVEELARLIANQDPIVPPQLRKSRILELPVSNILAGSGILGQLEEKTRAIIDYAEDPANDVILFIDEIHMLQSGRESYRQIAQIFKPALARGDLRVIGATTLQEATDLADDPAFKRRFRNVIVDEFTHEQTVEILRNVRTSMFSHYNNRLLVDDATCELVCNIADRYHEPGAHRPDTALTLLDQACADAFMDRLQREQSIKQVDPQLYQTLKANPTITLDESRIRKTAMLLMTGHATRERLDLASLDNALSEIKGQDAPIERIRTLLRHRDLELFDSKKPLAILMAGPSGVGKTALSRIVAQELCNCDPIMLNMTEYSSASTVNNIIGSSRGYVGSDSNTELPFDTLQSNPYQVIILDEIEKADRAVQRLFMSVLEEGTLHANTGVDYDFSHTIIFATTNAGAGMATRHEIGFSSTSGNDDAATAQSLSAWFDPEFLNRFTANVQFNAIGRDVYADILRARYEREAARINAEHKRMNLPATLADDEVERIVADTYVPEFGARPVERAVRAHIENWALTKHTPAPMPVTAPTIDTDDDADIDE